LAKTMFSINIRGVWHGVSKEVISQPQGIEW
jgi:hypothetical protein